jgi:hypothetical protein
MNKKQIFVVWTALLMLTSMAWFPGKWFDYIVEGYPVIRPDSMEFLIRVVVPVSIIALWVLYLLRDKKRTLPDVSKEHAVSKSRGFPFKSVFILAVGLLLGLSIGLYSLRSRVAPEYEVTEIQKKKQLEHDEFREFCKREGYKEELNALTVWIREKKAGNIAVLYNADDAYSADMFKQFSEKMKNEKIDIVFSDMFKVGESSFYSRLQIIESIGPEAIIFLGTYNDRLAFLENISDRSQLTFWKNRLDKIKWIE